MIVYENPDKSIVLVYPAQEFLESKGELLIALKDTPEGYPFWLVSKDEIPQDFLFSDAWEISLDWREPDGYGSQYYTFEELETSEEVPSD